MPFKVSFKVINVSSQDENFKGTELNIHGPTTKGWQSNRFCVYPQDIVIQLERRIHVKKIQILSHQYLIASKIEFYVGDIPRNNEISVKNARYTRLGYVALSDNERTEYKARELKSVHVDAVGHFIKLVIQKNHNNKHNKYNQVSLIAINVIGDEVLNPHSNEDSSNENVVARNAIPSDRPDYISPLDDLAFDMYQDPEVAQILRKLESLKQQAVADERYDYAKDLKNTIQKLQKVGEKLGKYEVEKRQAVDDEDYDKAKQKKIQMDEYRQKVYQHLKLGDIVELSSNIAAGETSNDTDISYGNPSSRRRGSSPHIADIPPAPSTEPVTTRDDMKPLSQGVPSYDERPLPAARRMQESIPSTPWTPPGNRFTSRRFSSPTAAAAIAANFSDLSINKGNDSLLAEETSNVSGEGVAVEPEPLSEMEEREAGGIIDVFGPILASKLYSKHWSFREEAVTSVHDELSSADVSSNNKDEIKSMLRAALLVFNKAIKDNVLSVFTSAINLHRYILSKFIVKQKIPRSEVVQFIDKSLPNLLMKTADTSARQRDAAKALIVEESGFNEVKSAQVLMQECVRPFRLNTAPRVALSRTEIIDQLFKQHGLSAGGLTVENMMGFLTVALSHTAGEVRECAEGIIVSLYKVVGPKVKDFLPPDDDQTRKNLLYKQLFKEFDKIDEQRPPQKKKQDNAERPQKKQPANVEPTGQQQQRKQTNPAPQEEKRVRSKDSSSERGGDPRTRLKTRTSDSDVINSGTRRDNDKVLHQDLTCIFCGEISERFTSEGLDAHYWKNCPMLTKCLHCNQVVEVSGLTEHMLTECEGGTEFVQCSRCSDAIPTNQFKLHAANNNCPKREVGVSRCPLCHCDLIQSDEAWRKHLMGREGGCTMNPRRPGASRATKSSAGKASPQRYTPNSVRSRYK